MPEPAPKRIAATITAESSGPASPVTVRWETDAAKPEVFVAVGDEPEKIVSSGKSGAVELNWILPGKDYVFRLYESGSPRVVLDEVSVRGNLSGSLSIESQDEADDLRTGTVLLQWEITAPLVAEVYLCEEGSEEKLVARGLSGSSEVSGLRAGIAYLFHLYALTDTRPLLAEATYFQEVKGSLTADPNPVTLESGGKTTLRWDITASSSGEIWISEDGGEERPVCRGPSGSFEVSGFKAGTTYVLRLYSQTTPRRQLDEVLVRVASIPWEPLRATLATVSGEEVQQIAELAAGILAQLVHHADYPKWFRLWEKAGVHVTKVHFYEPIPDLRTLGDNLWDRPQAPPGLDLNEQMQRKLLCEAFPEFEEEYQKIPLDAPAAGASFYLRNGRFEGLDPMLAYCMVRHFRPRQIIEVGSGMSTLILAQAACRNGATELHSVEPYPEQFLQDGFPGLTSLLAKKVEDVGYENFSRLRAGDFLFIDTSHVVRIGGDVNYLFLEVLPRLQPGVIVHIHDIFLPFEYPRHWVMEERRFWTEQYLLQAFLTYNSEFEVLISSGYLKHILPDEVAKIFPTAEPWQGGSFWMRRKTGE